MKKQVLCVLFGLLLAGCLSESPLERALRRSGNNREQLEQVLRHYARHPSDSLKYRAARFLIENMPGHGWYDGPELETYCRWVDSVYADKEHACRAMFHELGLQWQDVSGESVFHEDVEYLDSTFLITHIDSTFSRAFRCPWLQEVAFDEFCEYVLPYRVEHERPRLLYALQDSLYRADVSEMLGYDDFQYDPLLVLRIRPLYPPSLRNLPTYYEGHSLLQAIVACQCMTSYALWRAKLLMCPVAMDMTPAYPKRNDRHYWTVIASDDRMATENEALVRPEKSGKIYRHTFSRHAVPVPREREHVPFFFRNPFYTDVTRHYGLTSDVTIPMPKSLPVANAYLCVFNDLQWKPVAWAAKEKGRFRFKDMGRDIVYLPVIYPNGREVPISCPVVLYSTGKTEVLRPDTTRLLTLRLDRKYPQSHTVKYTNRAFENVFVVASDNPRFHRADSLGVFGTISLRQWTSAPITSSRAYRYWKIRASRGFILAECLFYDTEGNRVHPLGELPGQVRAAFDD
ncbi:MAG: hypothetical protein K2I90_03645, partial [Odoribacter sp.]|nr:hypothetical protein [Odoribacter sp.]